MIDDNPNEMTVVEMFGVIMLVFLIIIIVWGLLNDEGLGAAHLKEIIKKEIGNL